MQSQITSFSKKIGLDDAINQLLKPQNKTTMKPTILIVDDELPIRKLLDFFLSPTYEVVVKDDVPEAMNWLVKGNRPDAIILDIEMPVYSGKDLLKIIREDDKNNNIPIIMLSGNEKTLERIECLNLGADDYLVKPFNPLELEARINNLFKRSQRMAS
jgi:DNA-binding response OmpR family regulator